MSGSLGTVSAGRSEHTSPPLRELRSEVRSGPPAIFSATPLLSSPPAPLQPGRTAPQPSFGTLGAACKKSADAGRSGLQYRVRIGAAGPASVVDLTDRELNPSALLPPRFQAATSARPVPLSQNITYGVRALRGPRSSRQRREPRRDATGVVLRVAPYSRHRAGPPAVTCCRETASSSGNFE